MKFVCEEWECNYLDLGKIKALPTAIIFAWRVLKKSDHKR